MVENRKPNKRRTFVRRIWELALSIKKETILVSLKIVRELIKLLASIF
jgi:hypothetical protein